MATSTAKTMALIALAVILIFMLIGTAPFFVGVIPYFLRTNLMSLMHEEFVLHPGYMASRLIFYLPFILMLVFSLVIIVWVYRDAEKKGMNGVLWALLVFVGNVVGLLIYLIVRNDEHPRAVAAGRKEPCPSCGALVAQSFSFCPQCGTKLKLTCPACENPVEKDWKVCPHCGEELSSEE